MRIGPRRRGLRAEPFGSDGPRHFDSSAPKASFSYANICSCHAEATILHADADAFFASVEQRDDPKLRGRPLIVGGGVVLAASYEARAYGIRGGMNGGKARRLCPGVLVVPPRFDAYVSASKALFRCFRDTSPTVEGLSLEEAFLDVRGLEEISGTPSAIAARLRRRVVEEVGPEADGRGRPHQAARQDGEQDGQARRAAGCPSGSRRRTRLPSSAADRDCLGNRPRNGRQAQPLRDRDGR